MLILQIKTLLFDLKHLIYARVFFISQCENNPTIFFTIKTQNAETKATQNTLGQSVLQYTFILFISTLPPCILLYSIVPNIFPSFFINSVFFFELQPAIHLLYYILLFPHHSLFVFALQIIIINTIVIFVNSFVLQVAYKRSKIN